MFKQLCSPNVVYQVALDMFARPAVISCSGQDHNFAFI